MVNRVEAAKKEYQIKAANRCDRCGAQAYVWVTGVSGELFFCGHHYNEIMATAVGYDKMMKFAYQIVDETDKLIENRLVESN
jgi:ribosomal protein L37E